MRYQINSSLFRKMFFVIATTALLIIPVGCSSSTNNSISAPTPIVAIRPSEPTLQGVDAIVTSTLSVELPKHFYTLNEPIVATLKWKVTHGWLLAADSDTFYAFNTKVLASAGNLVERTTEGQRLCDQIELAFPSCEVDSIVGRSEHGWIYRLESTKPPHEVKIRITDWFNISMTGPYTVIVSTRNIINSSEILAGIVTQTLPIISEPITFTVLPNRP